VKKTVVTTCCTDRRCEVCAGTNRQVVIIDTKDPKGEARLAQQKETGKQLGKHSCVESAALEAEDLEKLQALVDADGVQVIAERCGVNYNTLRKAYFGGKLRVDVLDKVTMMLAEDDDEES
jgi:NACalpha-BTF3-like transcription factor